MELDELFGMVEKALEGEPSAQYRLGDCFYNGIGVNVDFQKACYWFEKAAEQGNIDAQYKLGLCYYHGNGLDKDYEKARLWYEKAAEQGNECSQINLAGIYEKGEGVERDYEKAAFWYKTADEQGTFLSKSGWFSIVANGLGDIIEKDSKRALLLAVNAIEAIEPTKRYTKLYALLFLHLGLEYERGILLKKDYKKVVYWYTKAAESGNVSAQISLSDIYYEGRGVKKNLEKAEYWILKAQESGCNDRTNTLKKIYSRIRNCRVDNINWIITCAERGIVEAQYHLGWYYEGKDDEKSIYWYTKAAEQGDLLAQLELGDRYGHGKGVEKNIDKAIYWYTKATEQGDACSLGCFYLEIGGAKNLENGVYWLTKAAEDGDARAQFRLIDCYLDGVGVEKDYKKAEYWLINGAIDIYTFEIEKLKKLLHSLTINYDNIKLFENGGNRGLIEAQISLAYFYAKTELDKEKAFKWYIKAAEQGHMDAQYEVGRCFILGVGTAKDIEEGKKWLNKAADQGHKEAQRELKEMNKTEETVGETKTQTSPQNNEISTNNTIATENKHITIPDVVPLPEDIRRYIDAEISENFRSKSAKWHYYVQSDEDLFFWKRLVQFTQRVKDVYERKGFYVTIDSYKYGIDFKFLIKTD